MRFLIGIGQLMLQEDQQQRQRRETLLAINDEFLTLLVAYDNRAQEVVAIVGNGGSFVTFFSHFPTQSVWRDRSRADRSDGGL